MDNIIMHDFLAKSTQFLDRPNFDFRRVAAVSYFLFFLRLVKSTALWGWGETLFTLEYFAVAIRVQPVHMLRQSLREVVRGVSLNELFVNDELDKQQLPR